jgi:hypothetical protein
MNHTSCERKRKYAWAQYFTTLSNNHNQTYEQYRAQSQLRQSIPPHLEKVFTEMYKKTREQIECVICIEPIEPDKLQLQFCGHILHKDCKEQWYSHNPSCPICRK